ncbi:crotonase/enoyl-CoA hydratase family protein [Nocardioides sp. ChNu-153]|uniref:crotonase/enoyl-CoA hydratase family protein n=1 Tax=unclassified Nocardioides TaxID=2615069 RepID=UPI002405EA47|nr:MULTISPECIES: crotonase/enoyl-CoA hydratase family protein [unclassified Nocardioides]MDF9716643.1 crotonase/enoyl-CoA hydratase family protein [Nocardioides sp. ChNu-99]MDN7123068.1 crotonase/enoyl-CoA hydratase family protein [Nocardioides sp. ChNu-153]
MTVHVESRGPVTVVTIDRPEVRNAVDTPTARALHAAFVAFDADPAQSVAVLTGAGGTFCAGADLKAVSASRMKIAPPTGAADDIGPMGPSRLQLSKPVIAAVEGYAVAGGLELALWCDLRVADPAATFGVFCRRWGVPLIDGGTIRLPALIGRSRALDLILTGRPVGADEALQMGLANRVSAPGEALAEAVELAEQIAGFPQVCLQQDRLSVYDQHGLPLDRALRSEWDHGTEALLEALEGATRFRDGAGRHGAF